MDNPANTAFLCARLVIIRNYRDQKESLPGEKALFKPSPAPHRPHELKSREHVVALKKERRP